MIREPLVFKENEYFCSPDTTALINDMIFIKNKLKLKNIKFLNVLLQYPKSRWVENTDIFQYIDLENLNLLRNTRCIFIFDATLEGYSENQVPLMRCLEFNCKNYNIDPKKIFLFTGNLINNNGLINIIPIFNIDNMIIPKYQSINNSIVLSSKLYQDKLFLSLSRRNRKHRVLAHCMLFNSDIFPFGLVSQSKIDDCPITEEDLKNLDLNPKQLKRFQKNLPLIADSDCFHINAPGDILIHLHHSTLFSIVNETLVNNYNNTTLFFSEKILKPIVNYQPMVIYGHQGINCKLNMLGYKTYENYFDLEFDNEPNDIIRYKKLLQSLSTLIKNLSLQSKDKQLEWRYKNKELLEFNYNHFLTRSHAKKTMNMFAEKVFNLFYTDSL